MNNVELFNCVQIVLLVLDSNIRNHLMVLYLKSFNYLYTKWLMLNWIIGISAETNE